MEIIIRKIIASKKSIIMLFLIYTIINLMFVNCLILPEYKINLTQMETIVLADNIDDTDEDEIIHQSDLSNFRPDENDFNNLHRHIEYRSTIKPSRYNYEKGTDPTIMLSNVYEADFDVYDVKNEAAWFDYGDHKRVAGKREENITQPATDYNYEAMKNEYYHEEQLIKKLNISYNATSSKNQTSLKKVVAEAKENCSVISVKGGVQLKCMVSSLKKTKVKHNFFKRLWNIAIAWLLIYIVVGIPLWCQKGWCCCCFQCKFCKPYKVIDEAKAFYALNPPGVFIDAKKHVINYKPTKYEKHAQNQLLTAIMDA